MIYHKSEIFRKWLRATKQNPNNILNPAWLVCGDNEKTKLMVNGFFTECYKATCFTSDEVSGTKGAQKFRKIASIFTDSIFGWPVEGGKSATTGCKREDLSASLIATLGSMSKAAFKEAPECPYRTAMLQRAMSEALANLKGPLMEEVNNAKASLSNSARENFGNNIYVDVDSDLNNAHAYTYKM